MIESQSIKFLDKLFTHLHDANINIGHWEIDHLCFRTSTDDKYEEAKKYFSQKGECLIESEVNGRLIATYKLHSPIRYKEWIIDLIEVPAPKPHKVTMDGFEHIEVVIDQPFSDIIQGHPHIKFQKKGLQKELNPELEIEFTDCAIKFHHKSLEHIINIEKNCEILNFLQETKILKILSQFEPCISGTLPLAIGSHQSDLDILLQSSDLDQFKLEVKDIFGKMPGFSIKSTRHQNINSVVVKFNFKDLPIELFCQDLCVYSQQANQHFLIEGRLLKLLGDEFKDNIKRLKENGVKTEPAFGKVLNLQNPYQELLELNQLSDSDLFIKYSSLSSL